MARFAVSAAKSVYAPHASQAEIIFFVGQRRKPPYLCIVKTAIERTKSRKKRAFSSGSGFGQKLNQQQRHQVEPDSDHSALPLA